MDTTANSFTEWLKGVGVSMSAFWRTKTPKARIWIAFAVGILFCLLLARCVRADSLDRSTVFHASTSPMSAAAFDVRLTSTTGAVTAYCAQTATPSGSTYTFGGVSAGACSTAPPPPPSGACPAGRYAQGAVTFNYSPPGALKSLTDPRNLFSYSAFIADFPWLNAHPATILAMPRSSYLALQFTVPANISAHASGVITHGSTRPGPALDASISPNCGDFSYAGVCGGTNRGTGGYLAKWTLPGSPNAGAYCRLEAGRTYFLNIRLHDRNVSHFQCNAGACEVSVLSNQTP